MQILLWLAPSAVVTVVAMVWVSWLGRRRTRQVDREELAARMAQVLDQPRLPTPYAPRPRPQTATRGTVGVRPMAPPADQPKADRRAS